MLLLDKLIVNLGNFIRNLLVNGAFSPSPVFLEMKSSNLHNSQRKNRRGRNYKASSTFALGIVTGVVLLLINLLIGTNWFGRQWRSRSFSCLRKKNTGFRLLRYAIHTQHDVGVVASMQ